MMGTSADSENLIASKKLSNIGESARLAILSSKFASFPLISWISQDLIDLIHLGIDRSGFKTYLTFSLLIVIFG